MNPWVVTGLVLTLIVGLPTLCFVCARAVAYGTEAGKEAWKRRQEARQMQMLLRDQSKQ